MAVQKYQNLYAKKNFQGAKIFAKFFFVKQSKEV